MLESKNRWVGALTLVVILVLVIVAVNVFDAGPAHPSSLTAAPSTAVAAATQPPETSTPSSTPSLTPSPTATSTPSRTPTPTLTPSPLPPTLTPTPTDTPTPLPTPLPRGIPTPITFLPGTPTPTPVVVTRTNSATTTMTLVAPTPVPALSQPQNVINILLLGSDQVGMGSVGRTDTIVIVSVHPDRPSVSLLSIPRDFYAWMPGRGFGKINTAFSKGGPALMEATIRHNFGVTIDYHARVSFDSFVKIVDALGGVEVAVECPLHDTFPDASSPSGETDVDLSPGMHHLDGKQALWYARSRWNTSDFDRHRRQQQVLRGLYGQIKSLGIIPKIPSLWGALRESVSTDLDLPGLVRLGAIGTRLDPIDVKSRFVGPSTVTAWKDPKGLYVLVPDYESLVGLVAEALSPPPIRSPEIAGQVEVVNGAPYQDWGLVAAERLRWEGFEVLRVRPAEEPQPRTQIIDLTTSSDAGSSSARYRLMRLYRLSAEDVVPTPKDAQEVDFVIRLGQDYDPCVAARSR